MLQLQMYLLALLLLTASVSASLNGVSSSLFTYHSK
ncbi:unnamed protein product [Haemonchus placei]|uniref:Secreted protein n=1 Tax=Haemonchus placei TaxID=6290 RepID=A0A0N4WFM6_HAEPC|nr:unnamed protein product [Haemonchus placei]